MHHFNVRAAWLAIGASLWLNAPAHAAGQVAMPLVTCELAANQTVTVHRQAVVGDTAIVSVSVNGQAAQPVFGDEDDASRGGNLKARCAGTAQARVLVIQGEFMGSGYPKGVAWAWNPYLHALQRVNFAERSFPSRAMLSPKGITLVMPNRSAETPGRWVTYSQGPTDTEPQVQGIDKVYGTTPQQTIVVGAPRASP
jgi:hypothetical protein